MKQYLVLVFTLFLAINSFSQYIGGQEADTTKISNWIPKFELEYTGVYHFGESESESDFNLFISGDKIVGQVKKGFWGVDGNWKSEFINLTNIKIDKNGNFTSDKNSGRFIKYENRKALIINNPWSSWIEGSTYEIGTKVDVKFKDMFYGKYTEASYKLLASNDFKNLAISELSIMRNEIYARYGYIFKTGGRMEKYFKAQKWYRPEYKNVDSFLTEIELYNIELIKKIEN